MITRDPHRTLSYYLGKTTITRLTVLAYFGYDARTTREVEDTRKTKKD